MAIAEELENLGISSKVFSKLVIGKTLLQLNEKERRSREASSPPTEPSMSCVV